MMKSLCILALVLCPLTAAFGLGGADSLHVVRDIRITGNDVTKEYVIRREMKTQPGDTLNAEVLKRDRDQIYNLGLFNDVRVDTAITEDGAVVIVTVTERWYILPFPILGMKYHDITKLYYGLEVSDYNFRGRNENISVQGALGYDQWAMFAYQNPKITDQGDISFLTSLTVQKVHNLSTTYGEYENNNVLGGATLGKRFGYEHRLYATLEYQVWQVSDPQTGRTASASGRDAFPGLVLEYRYNTRNDVEYTTQGTLVDLTAGTFGTGSSDVNISSASFDIKQFFGVGDAAGLGVRALGSFTWGGVIPPYEHVFFGYGDHIRGYFYSEIEGENRLGSSVELRLPLMKPRFYDADFMPLPGFHRLRYGIYFAIFTDAGTVWSKNQVVNRQPIFFGYGAGLHFLLPYGFTIRTEGALNDQGNAEAIIDFDTSF